MALPALMIAGCVSGVPVVVPIPGASDEPRPTEDVENELAVTPRDGAGAIVITRDKTWTGTGCTFDVSLDDQHVAGLRPGEQVTLYADPGERMVGVRIRGDEDCETAQAQVVVDVVRHATKTIEVGANSSFDLVVEAKTYGGALQR